MIEGETKKRFQVIDADERRLLSVRASNMTAADLQAVAEREAERPRGGNGDNGLRNGS